VVPWQPHQRKPRRQAHELVGVRIAYRERALRDAVKTAGGIWRPRQQLWEVSREAVRLLGLESRVVEAGAPRQTSASTGISRDMAVDDSVCP